MSAIVTVNPATGANLEEFAYTGAAELNSTLDQTVKSQREWRRQPFKARGAVLQKVAVALRSRSADLAATAVREMGKPYKQALAEVEKCAWTCDYYAEHGEAYLTDQPVETNAALSYVGFRPLGVVLAIMPWNFPYWQAFRAAAPAIMAGNGMVLKHASNVSRCALEIEAVFAEAGAPAGLFSTVLLNSDRIADLIADPRIAAVTLTGSEAAGMSVASAAGRALKKTVLELGGSDAFIVLADADLDAAVSTAVTARFQNNGQSCIAAKRFIVEEGAYEAFTERFAKASAAQHVGDPMDERTQLGPLARADLRDTLHDQVQASVRAGARIVCGGRPLERPGFFYEATVLADVTPAMPAFREETFGPVAAVVRARDAAHAVKLANDSQFGLGGNIWTRNLELARTLAAQMETGNVFINAMTASDPRLPFGGVKRSGYGRELGSFGIREFVNIQTVWSGPAKNEAPQKPGAE